MDILKKLLYRKKRKEGWTVEAYIDYVEKLQHDKAIEIETPSVCKWAHERGFYSNRVARYGLTDDNWQDYISDREFAWGFPYNDLMSVAGLI